MSDEPTTSGPGSGDLDDGVDTRDTDRIDYAAEFVHQTRMELRAIETALGAAENDFSGDLSPHQRRGILFGLSRAFRHLTEFSTDTESMMIEFIGVAVFEPRVGADALEAPKKPAPWSL